MLRSCSSASSSLAGNEAFLKIMLCIYCAFAVHLLFRAFTAFIETVLLLWINWEKKPPREERSKCAAVRKLAMERVALVVWFPSCNCGNCIFLLGTLTSARRIGFLPHTSLGLRLAVELS